MLTVERRRDRREVFKKDGKVPVALWDSRRGEGYVFSDESLKGKVFVDKFVLLEYLRRRYGGIEGYVKVRSHTRKHKGRRIKVRAHYRRTPRRFSIVRGKVVPVWEGKSVFEREPTLKDVKMAMSLRTPLAQSMDLKLKARPAVTYEQWMRSPQKYDIPGVDWGREVVRHHRRVKIDERKLEEARRLVRELRVSAFEPGETPLKVRYGDGLFEVSGETYENKEKLKKLGFRWDPYRRVWYTKNPSSALKLLEDKDLARYVMKDKKKFYIGLGQLARAKIKEGSEPGSKVLLIEPTGDGSVFQINGYLDNDTYEELINAFKLKIPGSEYSPRGPKYIKVVKKGSVPIGMLDRVVSLLKKRGYRVEVKLPSRLRAHRDYFPFIIGDKPLRPYQVKALENAMRRGRGIIQVATGGGKTTIATALIARYGRPTIFFVHTKDLLFQAKERLEKRLGIPVGIVGAGRMDIKPVTVAMIQTVSKKIDEKDPRIAKMLRNAEVVIFDEVHHVPAQTFYKVALKTRAPYR
ncbi:MAG: DEAD/DEAH box helicase family protein, partial [Candidatus Freyarchaeota archaeon]